MSVDVARTGIDGGAGRGEELVARARRLLPLLRSNAERTDQERRVPAENFAALVQAGVFRMMAPRRFGGFEAGIDTNVRVVRELSQGCGATGWTVCLLTGGAWFLGMWNERAQHDVWASNPDARVAVAVAPIGRAEVVEGGYRVSGRWSYSSGCRDADWVMVGVPMALDGAEPEPWVMLIPREQVRIEDTWRMVGMRGTASDTIVAEDVLVPAHRYIRMAEVLEGRVDTPFSGEAPYHVPFASAVTAELAGSQLGLAREALQLVVEQAGRRGVTHTCYVRQSDAPTVQLAVARAASAIDTAEALVFRATEEIDQAGRDRVRPSLVDRARLRMAATRGITEAREAIRELMSVAGASAFAEDNPLQRIWRDSEVASRHSSSNPAISAEVYGRALLGITEPITPQV